jgi:hypothetical protein
MSADIPLHDVVTAGVAFVFSLTGCLLGLLSFKRAVGAAGHGRRLGWLLLCSWALAATAVWDMFLVAAIDLQTTGLIVRDAALPVFATMVASVAAIAALLWLVALKATTVRILVSGPLIGAILAAICQQVLTAAIQTNATVTFRTTPILVGGVLIAIATTAALFPPVRSTRRGALIGMAALFAAALTAAHYLRLAAATVSQTEDDPGNLTGILPPAVLVPVALTFLLRLAMLSAVLLANYVATKASPNTERLPHVPSGLAER